MNNIIKKLISIATVFLFFSAGQLAAKNFEKEKARELRHLENTTGKAILEIKQASDVRAYDFLQLLPDVALSRRAPYSETPESETYVGVSFSISQLFSITDRARKREGDKRKAIRKVRSHRYAVRMLIERKYLMKEKLWRYRQIRKSMDNPLEIAKMDERIDELRVKLQDVCIEIERRYGEVEEVVVVSEG